MGFEFNCWDEYNIDKRCTTECQTCKNEREYLIKWRKVGIDKDPPPTEELLIRSPEGYHYLATWRPGYRIFTCQLKTESSDGWEWVKL